MKRVVILVLGILLGISSIVAGCYDTTRQAGIDYMNKGNYAKAEECFRAALVCPDKPQKNDINSLLAQIAERRYKADYRSAKALFDKERYEDAKVAFQKMLKRYPAKKKEINNMIEQCDKMIRSLSQNVGEESWTIAEQYISRGDTQSAVPYVRKAAEAGHAHSQYLLGMWYEKGENGISANGTTAIKWYEKSAAQDYAPAYNRLGWAYYFDEIVAKDETKVYNYFKKAAELGNSTGYYMFAWCYHYGVGVEANADTAIYWYQKAADMGDEDAQEQINELRGTMVSNSTNVSSQDELYQLATEYYNDGNYEQALRYYEQAAEQGHSDSMLQIGWFYDNGYGVERNAYTATRWYQSAAEAGNAQAQFNLAWNYANGEGVDKKDDYEAFEWYYKAASQGHAVAQNNVGEAYYYGRGITLDYEEAVYWYLKSAEQDNSNAQYSLGWCYEHGLGVAVDHSEARYWYRKAEAQGNSSASERLDNL